MTSTLSRGDHVPGDDRGGFKHEAFFYAGPSEFVDGAASFVHDGLASGEAVMVALPGDHLSLLRGALGADAERVAFADMLDIGRNPGTIIPAWRRFVAENRRAGRRFRGIGEPIYPGRGPEELAECQTHEVLLNVAFDGLAAWRLMCPYDVDALGPDVITEACRSHPFVYAPHGSRSCSMFDNRSGPDLLAGPLAEPPPGVHELAFDERTIPRVRATVARWIAGSMPGDRAADVLLAVHEIASNSVRHGGGEGRLRYWNEDGTLVCEVRDAGRIRDDLAGRELPPLYAEMGRGLWLAHQLCDLVQLRSSTEGTVVRLRMSPG